MSLSPQLRAIAQRQGGYFTSRQATEAGYVTAHQAYHVKSGNWLRIDRALFRLPGAVDTAESEFIRWSLVLTGKSSRRTVVVSHESALHYYGLQEKPEAAHLTVFPLRDPLEHPGCVLHRETLARGEYLRQEGFRIVTALQALLSAKPDLTYRCRWNATVRLAHEKGCITSEDARLLVAEGAGTEAGMGIAGAGAGWMREAGSPQGGVTMTTRPSQRGAFGREFTRARGSFTLVEMLVVIAIIGILAALLMPSLMKSIDSARAVACANNQRQIYMGGVVAYVNDNGNYIPSPCVRMADGSSMAYWTRQLSGYLGITQNSLASPDWGMARGTVYVCPADNSIQAPTSGTQQWAPYSFAMSRTGYDTINQTAKYRLNAILSPGRCMYLLDANNIWTGVYDTGYWNGFWDLCHSGGMNILFLDGHTKHYAELELPTDISNKEPFWSWGK